MKKNTINIKKKLWVAYMMCIHLLEGIDRKEISKIKTEIETIRNKISSLISTVQHNDTVEIEEGLDEILSICIGADSPDAQKNTKENPADELSKCQKDLSAISDISERLLELFRGE